MSLTLNYQDPTLFDEVRLVSGQLLVVKLQLGYILNAFGERLPRKELAQGSQVYELFDFYESAFDPWEVHSHSISYFETYGAKAKYLLDILEYHRFHLRLLEDEVFEECYVDVAKFFDELIEIGEKIAAIQHVMTHDLAYLNN